MNESRRNNPPISTRQGDDGMTTLLGSGRLSKSDLRINVLGDIDEASAAIGLVRAEAGEGEMGPLFLGMQRLLYRVMGDIAMPGEENTVGEKDVARVDSLLEEWRERVELPREFVVPGESRTGALLDVARAVVRRAERTLVAAGGADEHPGSLKAVNRLSDLLFVLARAADGHSSLSKSDNA